MPTWSLGLVQALQRPVSPQDRDRAAWHLLDWLACAFAGQAAPEAQPLGRWAAALPRGSAWACGHDSLQPGDAARFNGSLGSLLEMDDLHREAVVHPGDTVIPAALALAGSLQAQAHDLLDAIVVGYEAGIRLGLLAGAAHHRHWYATATTGAFASAMACARLLRLPAPAWAHALGLAGMQAAGVWQCRLEPGLAKQVAAGHAAQAGLAAASMAAAGMHGPQSILEGEHGWLRATGCEVDEAHARICLRADDDAPWRLHEVSFKPWPACRHVHPAIACALRARAAGVTPQAVERLELRTYPTALAFADQKTPATSHQARFSLQHGLAWALCEGGFGLEASRPRALAREDIADLRARVSLSVDEGHAQAYPRRFGASLRVWLRGGALVDVRQEDAPGDPESPLGAADLRAKAIACFGSAGMGNGQASDLADHALALPGLDDLAPWWERLRQASQVASVSRA